MRVLSQAKIARCTNSELHALLRVIAIAAFAGEFAGAARGSLQPAEYPHGFGAAGIPAPLILLAALRRYQ